MPPSTIPSIFNAISSPDPRCENSEAMLPRNGKALSQPHELRQFWLSVRTSCVTVTKPPHVFKRRRAKARQIAGPLIEAVKASVCDDGRIVEGALAAQEIGLVLARFAALRGGLG